MAIFGVMTCQDLQTPTEVRQWLERHGVTVSDWARAHDFDPAVVFALLSGRTRGRRGKAFEVAVALKLRPAPAREELHPLHDSEAARSRHPQAEEVKP